MDLATIQALATLVNSVGLPATMGVIAILAAWQLLPVLAEYLRSKIHSERANAELIKARMDYVTSQSNGGATSTDVLKK